MADTETETSSNGVLYVFEGTAADNLVGKEPPAPWQILHRMRSRVREFGAPLPDGYVPPPGIDIEALLKQVPWPPPANG